MRCSPGVVSLIKEKLTSIRMLIWEHTCFNMWIKERCTLADSVMVHLMFQHEIKSDLNPRSDGLFYVLVGEPLRFCPREFCLITGLRFGKWDAEVPSLDSNFKDRVFGGKRMKIEHAVVSVDACMDDFLVALVDDINAWNRYPWGSYMWDLTYPHLHNCFERKKEYVKKQNLPWMNYSLPVFAWAFKGSKVFKLGVVVREDPLGARCEVFEEKQTGTNADSQMLDMILNMMLQYFSGKRKWSSEEEEPTQPPNDHEEVEGMVFRNENIDDFDVKAAETPLPSVEVVERPKRTKRPSSTVLSPYIVYKKKQHKKNNVFM
ncbi:hypothetical protein L1987_78516 [Smallanthus sonchifolius]|uniref:Uncharacterized protein n=1 Tax=Smallanthus sonchifolius TaxID=185202 RepID=A0ACB8ZC34_9ASTR|nr:hypothetical protein L1987_78516 [Smallanthus sonchifolius]